MKNVIVTTAFIFMALTIFWLWNRNYELKKDFENYNHKPDTVWYNKPFNPKPEYPVFNVPSMVFIYQTDTVQIDRVEYVDNIITITKVDSVKVEYNGQFLTNYPDSPKLLQILSDKNKLSVSTFNTDCSLTTQEYYVNYDRYSYNYQNGNLTSKKKSFFQRFKPVAEYTLRPFNNLHDFNLGLKYNTTKFNYEAGLNLNYYPKLNDGVGADLYLRVQYNF